MDPTKVHPSNLTAAMLRSVRRSKWADAVANNPQHSAWYVNRFRQMAAGGADLVGEARLIDAMAPRPSWTPVAGRAATPDTCTPPATPSSGSTWTPC